MNRNIIIAIIIIILIAIVGAFALSQGKADTQINFLSQTNLKNGDTVQFELKDAQGNVLSNQQVNITFSGNGESQTYTVTTDSQGKGGLLLSNENTGDYSVNVAYGGDDKHNGCQASQTISIGEGISDAESTSSTSEVSSDSTADSSTASDSTTSSSSDTSSSDSSSSDSSSDTSNLNYDSELNVYYDDNGQVVGGQSDGASYEDLKNNAPTITEDGSI